MINYILRCWRRLHHCFFDSIVAVEREVSSIAVELTLIRFLGSLISSEDIKYIVRHVYIGIFFIHFGIKFTEIKFFHYVTPLRFVFENKNQNGGGERLAE